MDDLTTVAGRLRSLIGDQDTHRMSIRAFADAMQGRTPKPHGSTRAMIHRYLRDDGPDPPRDFLAAAAELLEVPAPWLAFGEKPSTPASADQVAEEIRAGATAIYMMTMDAGDAGGDVLASLVRALARAQPGQAVADEDLVNLAGSIAATIARLAGAIRPSAPVPASTAVAISILSALLAYAPGPGEGRAISEIVSKLPVSAGRA